jgi:hypothetical protein
MVGGGRQRWAVHRRVYKATAATQIVRTKKRDGIASADLRRSR